MLKTQFIPAVAFACMISSVHAVVIDIDGATNEFSDYSGLSASNSNPDPWGTSSVIDGDVTLSIINDSVNTNNGSLVGLSWNNSWSSGSYEVGAEINTMQSQTASNTDISADATEAVAENRFLTLSLSSAGSAINWDSIDVTLWRNGDGAPVNYQFAYDDEGTGYDTDDLLGSPLALGSGIAGIDTIGYSGAGLPNGFTSDSLRLYFWAGTSGTGNFHITEVESNYSVVPEPSTFFYLFATLGSIIALRRRLDNRG